MKIFFDHIFGKIKKKKINLTNYFTYIFTIDIYIYFLHFVYDIIRSVIIKIALKQISTSFHLAVVQKIYKNYTHFFFYKKLNKWYENPDLTNLIV